MSGESEEEEEDDELQGGVESRENGFCGQEEREHENCKYNTSNDVFSRCKGVHKMATGKK